MDNTLFGRAGQIQTWLQERREWQRRALGLITGVLAVLAYPPFHAVPVLFIAFPCLLILAYASESRVSAFAVGWWFGLGHFVAGLYWVGVSFAVNPDVNDLGGPFAVGLLAGVLAFFVGFATLGFHLVSRWLERTARPLNAFGLILLFALFWSCLEWLRGHVFTGFPWNLTGSVWVFWPAPMQALAIVGSYGLGLVTMIVVLFPVALIQERAVWPRFGPMIVSMVTVLVMVAGGHARLPGGDAPATDVEVRVVQANIDQRDKWRADVMSDNFVKYLEMSAAPRTTPANVIIWPETAIPYFLEQEPARRFLIADVIPPGGYLVTGAPRIQRHGDGSYNLWNSVHALDGRGEIVATYDKTHLVPFGEYVPLRNVLELFGVSRFVPSEYDFTPGVSLKSVSLPSLPTFSPLICYEIIFPGAVARNDDRPHWLLNVTNDGWYGDTTGPRQHLVAARMRAVEEGVPVVRAAGTGISAVIDPWGRVIDRVGLNREGVIDVALPRMVENRTVYARLGDWGYGGLLAIVTLLALSSFSVRNPGAADPA